MKNIVLTLFFFALCTAGVILLQLFLSHKANKWLGLILPALSFTMALVTAVGIMAFSATRYESITQLETEDGVAVTESETPPSKPEESTSVAPVALFVFLRGNIPTLVLLGIHFACREKLARKSELDKMNIRDLE